MIKDSGTRREFETGAVRDIQEGKGRCDLLPLDAVAELLAIVNKQVLSEIDKFKCTGDILYLEYALIRFVEKIEDIEPTEDPCLFDGHMSTIFLEVSKHFEEGAKKYGEYNWQKGIPTHCYIDSAVRHFLKFIRGDKDEPHDRAFVWNILCCMWTCKNKPELNDYPRKVEDEVKPEVKEDKPVERCCETCHYHDGLSHVSCWYCNDSGAPDNIYPEWTPKEETEGEEK